MDKNKIVFLVTKKDFKLSWFSGTGTSGQRRNRSCCRLKHIDTNIIKTGQSNRTRQANQAEALQLLGADVRFKVYCHMQLISLAVKARGEKTIKEVVEETIRPENLKIQFKQEGKWIDE